VVRGRLLGAVHRVHGEGQRALPTRDVPGDAAGYARPWKKVDYVKAFNWLNYYGGKFSTSQRRGIFTDAALELLPADYWRYFLIANAPESDDTSFTWELFAPR